MTACREEVKTEDRWNVEAVYPGLDEWERALDKATEGGWHTIDTFKGRLGESSLVLKELLDQVLSTERQLTLLYTYAHLRHDEDIANDENKSAYGRATALLHQFMQAVSWVEPELLSLPQATIDSYLISNDLKDYRFHIEKIVRVKQHTLSPDQERLLALSAQSLQSTMKAFSAINDADFKFSPVADEKGKTHTLTHATYGIYMRSHDRTLRKNSFTTLHDKYRDYNNTLCELLNGQVQAHLFNARARNYPSCLDAALYPKNISTNVYHSLITAVSENLAPLHRYYRLRERVLGIAPLHLYDMSVPITKEFDMRIPYDEAAELIVQSVAPLGADYQAILQKGLTDNRWVDRYENANKRSGAYSSGSYDTMPYILMNYKDLVRDLFTLAHEAGHSMHSHLTRTSQPYQYGDYSIFVAEVASTFNEELLMQSMLKKARSKEEKIYLINQKIEDIRGTLFRQTMFAEFELYIHQMAENGTPLTPKLLTDHYLELVKKYFGSNVNLDPEIGSEWARIPHFYYNFYVYQYATGISAALALSEKVLNGGAAERDAYLAFLQSGCSLYPIDTLKLAGVDMETPAPVIAAIGKFETLVNELEQLV